MIPEDVRIAANMAFNAVSLRRRSLRDPFRPSEIYTMLETAILAERKRCADIARAFTDTTPFAGEVIANDIEFGAQP